MLFLNLWYDFKNDKLSTYKPDTSNRPIVEVILPIDISASLVRSHFEAIKERESDEIINIKFTIKDY